MRKLLALSYATLRKAVVAVVGTSVVLVGVAMIVLPGPALLIVPLGLGILAVEFSWARRWLAQLRNESERLVGHLRRRTA